MTCILLFNYFDKEDKGSISFSEFKKCLSEMGADLLGITSETDEREAKIVFSQVDTDGDGHIKLDEFM